MTETAGLCADWPLVSRWPRSRTTRQVDRILTYGRGVGEVGLSGQLLCKTAEEAQVVIRHLPEHVRLTRAEAGCLRFDVVPTSNALTWQVDETFGDLAAFRAHKQRVASSPWGLATASIERRYSIEGFDD